jgi:serine palmitoyltransferase
MWPQLDPRSDWVRCTSAPDNPVMLLVLKNQHIEERNLSIQDQESLLQDCVDDALANGVLITRVKAMPHALGVSPRELEKEWQPQPALKVCITSGLSKREIERAGTTIRHAVTNVMRSKKWQRPQ